MTTMRCLGFSLVLCALFLAGCRSAETNHNAAGPPSPSPASSPAEVKSKIDVCNLLSSDDLKEVQGEAYTDAQRSDRLEGEVIVAQCYYALPTTVNSVVINVTTAKDEARSLRGIWEQRFGAGEEKAVEGKEEGEREKAKESREREKTKAQATRERGNEEEEKEAKPQRVQDLGDEAFWIGSPVGGALYVLKRDLFFRVSVGGAGDQKTKLNKSKALAQKILKKL